MCPGRNHCFSPGLMPSLESSFVKTTPWEDGGQLNSLHPQCGMENPQWLSSCNKGQSHLMGFDQNGISYMLAVFLICQLTRYMVQLPHDLKTKILKCWECLTAPAAAFCTSQQIGCLCDWSLGVNTGFICKYDCSVTKVCQNALCG